MFAAIFDWLCVWCPITKGEFTVESFSYNVYTYISCFDELQECVVWLNVKCFKHHLYNYICFYIVINIIDSS